MIPLLPTRLLGDLAFCPRLFALEWACSSWAEGTGQRLADRALGLVTRVEVHTGPEGDALPVEHASRSDEHALVRLCAKGLLLRARGRRCTRGLLKLPGLPAREVPFTDALVDTTLRLRDEAHALARSGELPAPSSDPARCRRCPAAALCAPVRPVFPVPDDALPLHVPVEDGSLGTDGQSLLVRDRGREVARAPLDQAGRVLVLGRVRIEAPLRDELARRGIPLQRPGRSLMVRCRPQAGQWEATVEALPGCRVRADSPEDARRQAMAQALTLAAERVATGAWEAEPLQVTFEDPEHP